jgi:hypothetical protein
MTCQRCYKETLGHTGSYFDTSQICFECADRERAHPAFEAARQRETEECARGNFNFPGVGLPADLRGAGR